MSDTESGGTERRRGTRIEAPNVCPNGGTGHLVEMGPGVLRCLNCSIDSDTEQHGENDE